MNYNVSASDLQTRVSTDLVWNSPSITQYPIDKNGKIITNASNFNQTTGYTYFINFTLYRSPFNNVQLQPFVSLSNINDYYVTFSLNQIVAPSPPISGSIIVNFNGSLLNIPGNSTSLYPYFTNPGLDRGFYTEIDGSNLENHYYLIKFSGLINCPQMTLQTNGLSGGVGQPLVQIKELIHSSNNLYYDPIPNEMLFSLSKLCFFF